MCPYRQQKVLGAVATPSSTIEPLSEDYYCYGNYPQHHINPHHQHYNQHDDVTTMLPQLIMDPSKRPTPTATPTTSTSSSASSSSSSSTSSSCNSEHNNNKNLVLVPYQASTVMVRENGNEVIKRTPNNSSSNSPPPPAVPQPQPPLQCEMGMSQVIEMLKNLAARQEKQYKWEQSARKLTCYPDTDPNKSQLVEIIDFVENHKSSTREKAIYLYEQLGNKCGQHKNFIGAAKAFERAAALRYDQNLDVTERAYRCDEHDTIMNTIKNLESAIYNYDAIHKYKHAGTLHYQCSNLLRKINASREEVERHHVKALEYFTKPNHELKQRKRIDGLKISCYSSYWMTNRMHSEMDKFTTTTTTKFHTNTIKFHHDHDEPIHSYDSDDSDSNHSSTPPPSSGPMGSKKLQFSFNEDRHHPNYHSDDYFVPDYFSSPFEPNSNGSYPSTPTGTPPLEKPGKRSAPFDSVRSNLFESTTKESSSASSMKGSRHHHHHSSYSYHHKKMMSSSAPYPTHHVRDSNNNNNNQIRCIEDRIESAKKLVKKLHKICPFYEVSTAGDDAGRVYCRICDRYLGAVSSTLKNHINTQEHRQAWEDSQTDTNPPVNLPQPPQPPFPAIPQMPYASLNPTSSDNLPSGSATSSTTAGQFYPQAKAYLTYDNQTTAGTEAQANSNVGYAVESNEFLFRTSGASNGQGQGQGGTVQRHHMTFANGQAAPIKLMPTQPPFQMGSNATTTNYTKNTINMPVLAYQ